MKKVGLTGGIASGKSTSVSILLENGFKVIDSDMIVKNILREDEEVIRYIEKEFGNQFVYNNKILKREFGNYIFTYEDERIKYENFIMDKIFNKINEEFSFHEKNHEKLCILDAPLLIEKNLHKEMDYVVLIWVSAEEQLKRLIDRDKIDEENAIKRINSQIDIDFKKQFADFIVDNSKGKEYLRQQIHRLCVILKTLQIGGISYE